MRRILGFNTVLILCLTVLISCGGGEKEASKKTEDGRTILRIATWTTITPWWEKTVSEFEKEYPEIKIELVETPAPEHGIKVATMMAGRDNVDVVYVKSLTDYISYVKNGYLMDISDQMNNISAKEKEVLKSSIDALTIPFMDNKIYSAPFRSDVSVLYYNKDIFDKAGIPYPTDDVTWDYFMDTAKKIKNTTGIYGAYIHTWAAQVTQWDIGQNKGDVISGDYQYLKPAYERILKMQNIDKSILAYNTAKAGNIHYRGEFNTGKAAMILMGTYHIGFLLEEEESRRINWGIAPLPYDPKDEKPGRSIQNPTGIAINAHAANPNLAWKYLKFMMDKRGADIISKTGTYTAYVDKDIMNNILSLPGFPNNDSAKKALNPSETKTDSPPHPYLGDIIKAIDNSHSLIMSGNVTVDEGITELESRVAEILAK